MLEQMRGLRLDLKRVLFIQQVRVEPVVDHNPVDYNRIQIAQVRFGPGLSTRTC